MADGSIHALSYMCTPSTTPYIYQTVPERLCFLATEDPGRVAFIFYDMAGEKTVYWPDDRFIKNLCGSENYLVS